MAAVASVIRNRLAAGGYGKTPTEVVHQPYQFTPWNSGSGNDPTRFQTDSPAYKQAQALAQGVFNGTIQDQTNGATHFFAPAAHVPWPFSSELSVRRSHCLDRGSSILRRARLAQKPHHRFQDGRQARRNRRQARLAWARGRQVNPNSRTSSQRSRTSRAR